MHNEQVQQLPKIQTWIDQQTLPIQNTIIIFILKKKYNSAPIKLFCQIFFYGRDIFFPKRNNSMLVLKCFSYNHKMTLNLLLSSCRTICSCCNFVRKPKYGGTNFCYGRLIMELEFQSQYVFGRNIITNKNNVALIHLHLYSK